MRFSYGEYDPSKASRQDLLKRLKDLYQDLLLQADGDPEQALEWLEMLAERYGLFPKGFTIDDLKAALKEERLVEETASGLRMAPGGERALRNDPLQRIFSGLSQAPAGKHLVAAQCAGWRR